MPLNEFNIQFLNGRVLPPLPPFPKGNDVRVTTAGGLTVDVRSGMPDKTEVTQFGTPQVMPLKIKLSESKDEDYWLLPVECLISVNGKNNVVKRQVAKGSGRGTIKEYWSQDDYQIQIQGTFTRQDTTEYPEADLKKLRTIVEARSPIDVLSPIFEVFDINRIVIENCSFPHTKGEENQNWVISAVSDDDWNLLLNIDDIGKDVL